MLDEECFVFNVYCSLYCIIPCLLSPPLSTCPFASFKLILLFSSCFTPHLLVLQFPLLSCPPPSPVHPTASPPHHIPISLIGLLHLINHLFSLGLTTLSCLSLYRNPTCSQFASAVVTAWTLTTQCVSSACSVTVERASLSSCLSYTAASAPVAKVGIMNVAERISL